MKVKFIKPMDHKDHVNLIKGGVGRNGGVWADLGSGWGAFTLALRDTAGPAVEIYSIDKDSSSLDEQKNNFIDRFKGTNIHFLNEDYSKDFRLPKLDGVIMANSLHFFKDKITILKKIRSFFKKNGRLIIIEYDIDEGNIWVPYPVSFNSLSFIVIKAGYNKPEFLNSYPSGFLIRIYSALIIAK